MISCDYIGQEVEILQADPSIETVIFPIDPTGNSYVGYAGWLARTYLWGELGEPQKLAYGNSLTLVVNSQTLHALAAYSNERRWNDGQDAAAILSNYLTRFPAEPGKTLAVVDFTRARLDIMSGAHQANVAVLRAAASDIVTYTFRYPMLSNNDIQTFAAELATFDSFTTDGDLL